MKRFLIVLVFVFVFLVLTGCVNTGYISVLPNFILPDDEEFMSLVEELQTPEEIYKYTEANFRYVDNSSNSSNLSPYEFFNAGGGNCGDFSNWIAFILNYHGYEVYQILIEYPPLEDYWFPRYHMITAVKEDYYYNIFDPALYIQCFCEDFGDIMKGYRFKGWISYTVYDYDMNIVESVELK